MDRVENKTAARAEDVDAFFDLLADFVGSAEGQSFLGIDAAAPEDDLVAEFRFQGLGVHPGSGSLDRVKDVKTSLDEIGEQLDDRAAGVDEDFPGGIFMHPVVEAFLERLEKAAVSLGGDEGAILCAKIGTGHEDHVNFVAHSLVETCQVLQGNLALTFKNSVNIIVAGYGTHIPLGYIADAARVFQEGCRHQGDIAKGGPAHIQYESFVGFRVEAVYFIG